MLYELLFQLIYHDPIRIYNGRIWEVMEKNEKESSVTMVLYKVTKTLLVSSLTKDTNSIYQRTTNSLKKYKAFITITIVNYLTENTNPASSRGSSTPVKDFYVPFKNEGLFIVFSHPFIIISFQKSYLCLVANHPAAMKTDDPELRQPGKAFLGSDRIRNQRCSAQLNVIRFLLQRLLP